MDTGLSSNRYMRGIRLHRLIKLIALLRGPSSWNAPRLAEYFDTGRRNIHRDLKILEHAGVPFYYDPDFGQGGGYRIKPEFFFPNIGLTDQACLDLAIITLITKSQAIPLLHDVSEVRDKVFSTLSRKQQDLIEIASDLFDVLSLGMAEHGHCRSAMLTIQKALLSGKQLDASYLTPHEGRPKRIRIEPRRVFLCSQAWYLVARDCADREDKLYRLARFRSIKIVDKPAGCGCEGFSLREFLGNAWTVHRGDREYHVEIRFDRRTAPLVMETKWHGTQEIEPHTDGAITFHATVSGLDEIKFWVLHWGPGATVIKPRELREEVKTLLKSCLDLYEQPAP